MSESVVERVARALCDNKHPPKAGEVSWWDDLPDQDPREGSEWSRQYWRVVARAAIEAMRGR